MFQYGSLRHSPVPIGQKKARLKKLMFILKWLLFIFVLVSVLVLFLSVYVGWQLTHPEKKVVKDSPANYQLVYKDIELESQVDGTLLSGWQMEAKDPQGIIIFSHGYGMNRLQEELPALDLAKQLVEAGFHVFLFDYRNSGQSAGSLTSIGYYEQGDLLTFVHYARAHYPELPIGVIGFSMGAATAILAAGQDEAIRAVVADSSFSNLKEYLRDNLPYWSGLPHFPFTPVILTVMPVLTGIEVEQVSPRDTIKDSGIPHLLIHGEADPAIHYQQSEELVQYAERDNVSLWLVPEAGHVGAYALFPKEYAQRVIQFFKESFQMD